MAKNTRCLIQNPLLVFLKLLFLCAEIYESYLKRTITMVTGILKKLRHSHNVVIFLSIGYLNCTEGWNNHKILLGNIDVQFPSWSTESAQR